MISRLKIVLSLNIGWSDFSKGGLRLAGDATAVVEDRVGIGVAEAVRASRSVFVGLKKRKAGRRGMVEDLEMVFEPLPGEALVRFLTDNISSVNIAKTGVSTWHPVGFFLKNVRGEWLGGLTGYIWGGWLHVDVLWITELLRGQGHGSRLRMRRRLWLFSVELSRRTSKRIAFKLKGSI